MPITFSVTCDSDAELARFLENLRFGEEFSMATVAQLGDTEAGNAGQKSKSRLLNSGKKTTLSRDTVTSSKKKPAVGRSLKSRPSSRKSGKLVPIIENAIQDMVKKGKPFRSKQVTEFIMKKNPELNENSVTTGVSKLLSESPLKWEQIKDAIGRPYKLYKP